MKIHLFAGVVGALLAFALGAEAEPLLARQAEDGEFEGWASYHEKAGTKTGEVWTLGDEGVLACAGQPRGYLHTKKSHANFTLSFEWRWPPGGEAGKGGVLLRMVGGHKIWPKSLEVQLNAGSAGDFWGIGGYKLTAAPERTEKISHKQYGDLIHVTRLHSVERPAGEWNEGSVTLKDGQATVRMNGKVVNEASGCDAGAGRIVLTAEGTAIEFRKVELKAGD